MQIARTSITLVALDEVTLPLYKGSTLRGALGRALQELVCIRRDRQCAPCSVHHICAYTFLFETGLYFSQQKRPDSGGVPQPFVLEPPREEKQLYKPAEKLSFSLVLIGRGIDYLSYIIAALEKMAHRGMGRGRGRLELLEVVDGYSGVPVYEQSSGQVNLQPVRKSWTEIEQSALALAGKKSCRITLLTPLRFKQSGRLSSQLDFTTLIRVVLRRLIYLSEYFGPITMPLPYRELLARAGQVSVRHSQLCWQDWCRYSSRQDTRMKLGGLTGHIEYAGDLDHFWPLLLLGQEVHIGKNTTFGLGQYSLQ